ncbi:hypothetical protein FGO68_gene8440 [Halteria grandinella]|uniref:C2H2-type domain-containing protein n=1 Tax=Halteria grandinella TaxID=5974 RepID=A0A8J8P3S9_HALGN|nr:hypothetical protein FGO68_gene8440 [Halteria grandinella]
MYLPKQEGADHYHATNINGPQSPTNFSFGSNQQSHLICEENEENAICTQQFNQCMGDEDENSFVKHQLYNNNYGNKRHCREQSPSILITQGSNQDYPNDFNSLSSKNFENERIQSLERAQRHLGLDQQQITCSNVSARRHEGDPFIGGMAHHITAGLQRQAALGAQLVEASKIVGGELGKRRRRVGRNSEFVQEGCDDEDGSSIEADDELSHELSAEYKQIGHCAFQEFCMIASWNNINFHQKKVQIVNIIIVNREGFARNLFGAKPATINLTEDYKKRLNSTIPTPTTNCKLENPKNQGIRQNGQGIKAVQDIQDGQCYTSGIISSTIFVQNPKNSPNQGTLATNLSTTISTAPTSRILHDAKKQTEQKFSLKYSDPPKSPQNIALELESQQSNGFICELCGQMFTRNNRRRIHILNKHTPESDKPMFKCEHPGCEKTFSEKGNLKVHQRTHSGEKPFGCQFCDMRFTSLGNKRDHERRHQQFKPYQCEFCDKSYFRRYLLNNHLSTHHKGKESQHHEIFQHPPSKPPKSPQPHQMAGLVDATSTRHDISQIVNPQKGKDNNSTETAKSTKDILHMVDHNLPQATFKITELENSQRQDKTVIVDKKLDSVVQKSAGIQQLSLALKFIASQPDLRADGQLPESRYQAGSPTAKQLDSRKISRTTQYTTHEESFLSQKFTPSIQNFCQRADGMLDEKVYFSKQNKQHGNFECSLAERNIENQGVLPVYPSEQYELKRIMDQSSFSHIRGPRFQNIDNYSVINAKLTDNKSDCALFGDRQSRQIQNQAIFAPGGRDFEALKDNQLRCSEQVAKNCKNMATVTAGASYFQSVYPVEVDECNSVVNHVSSPRLSFNEESAGEENLVSKAYDHDDTKNYQQRVDSTYLQLYCNEVTQELTGNSNRAEYLQSDSQSFPKAQNELEFQRICPTKTDLAKSTISFTQPNGPHSHAETPKFKNEDEQLQMIFPAVASLELGEESEAREEGRKFDPKPPRSSSLPKSWLKQMDLSFRNIE